jgi:hypothetical protein
MNDENRMAEPDPRSGSQDNTALARAIAAAGDAGDDKQKLGQLVGLVMRSARAAGAKAVTSGHWFADVALEVAEHVQARDLAALRAHHRGLAGPLLAGTLIRNAARTTAAVGAATGALAAASETTPATWGTLPLELAAETLVVVAVEMKLVAELHEAAGLPLPTGMREKGTLVAKSWADGRGVHPQDMMSVLQAARTGATGPLTGAAAGLLGRSARDQLAQQLRRRLMRRAGKNVVSLTPMLIGAVAGAALNRRATRRLGLDVAASLGIAPPRS